MFKKWILTISLLLFCCGCMATQNGEGEPPYVMSDVSAEKVAVLLEQSDVFVESVAEPAIGAVGAASVYYPPLAGLAGILGTAVFLYKKFRPEIDYWKNRYTAHKRGAESFMRKNQGNSGGPELYESIGEAREKLGI